MEDGIEKLKKIWNENPLQLIAVGALAATAFAKLLDATTSARNSRAWQKEVYRRIMMKKR